MVIAPDTPLLRSLEDLASLSEDYGLIKIKPFRDWRGSTFSPKIFKMRLCNSGEMLDIGEALDKYPKTAIDQALKLEVLIRSLFSIDGHPLVEDSDVHKYNTEHSTDIDKLQFLRLWSLNLEQLVIDRLYSIYGELQLKQLRKVNGQYMCEMTREVYDTIPEGAYELKYAIGEIITAEGIEAVGDNLSWYTDDMVGYGDVEEVEDTDINTDDVPDNISDVDFENPDELKIIDNVEEKSNIEKSEDGNIIIENEQPQ
jgi:hypothetical protein